MKNRRKIPLEIEEPEAETCTLDVRLKILHNLPFFRSLTHDAIKEINNVFNDTKYHKDDTIYFSGDRSTRLCVVASGSVKLMKHNEDGKEILIDILKQGEFFGNLDPFGGMYNEETAVAQLPSCIMKIDSENFRKILHKYPVASLQVLDIIAKRLREAQEMIRQLSTHSVENRIAYTLIKLAEKLGAEKDIGLLLQIPLSRNDLASMTGTTPETASRIISKFKEEGVIQTGRKWIAIKHINKLKEKLDLN